MICLGVRVLMPMPTYVTMATANTEAAGRHIGLFKVSKRQYLYVNIVCPSYRLFHAFNRLILNIYQPDRETICGERWDN